MSDINNLQYHVDHINLQEFQEDMFLKLRDKTCNCIIHATGHGPSFRQEDCKLCHLKMRGRL
jgi:hypothetical protein